MSLLRARFNPLNAKIVAANFFPVARSLSKRSVGYVRA